MMRRADTNILTEVFIFVGNLQKRTVWVLSSFGYIPKSTIAGSVFEMHTKKLIPTGRVQE